MATKHTGLTKDDLISVGFDLATHMVQAEQDMESTKRKLIIGVVKKYRASEQIEAILQGYADYYVKNGYTDSTIRVRKAELKSVFDAVTKTEVTEDHLKLLEEFDGGFHAWIAYARELRGTSAARNTSGRGAANKLTDKQQAKVHELIGQATPEQAAAISEDAVKNIVVLVNKNVPESVQMAGEQTLRIIMHHANVLASSDKFDDFFKNAGQQVLEVLSPIMKQIEEAKKLQQQTTEMAQGVAEPIAA